MSGATLERDNGAADSVVLSGAGGRRRRRYASSGGQSCSSSGSSAEEEVQRRVTTDSRRVETNRTTVAQVHVDATAQFRVYPPPASLGGRVKNWFILSNKLYLVFRPIFLFSVLLSILKKTSKKCKISGGSKHLRGF